MVCSTWSRRNENIAVESGTSATIQLDPSTESPTKTDVQTQTQPATGCPSKVDGCDFEAIRFTQIRIHQVLT